MVVVTYLSHPLFYVSCTQLAFGFWGGVASSINLCGTRSGFGVKIEPDT